MLLLLKMNVLSVTQLKIRQQETQLTQYSMLNVLLVVNSPTKLFNQTSDYGPSRLSPALLKNPLLSSNLRVK